MRGEPLPAELLDKQCEHCGKDMRLKRSCELFCHAHFFGGRCTHGSYCHFRHDESAGQECKVVVLLPNLGEVPLTAPLREAVVAGTSREVRVSLSEDDRRELRDLKACIPAEQLASGRASFPLQTLAMGMYP
jgi:hypothetical protein